MSTRTRNALRFAALLAVLGTALWLLARTRPNVDLSPRALSAIPAGALVTAVVDLGALRASPIGPRVLQGDRDIPGLGKVRDVCGIDPMERVRELAFAIPAAGEDGDFGVAAVGDVPDDAIVECARKIIDLRGGRAVVATVGSFRTVRDATLVTSGAEIAVNKSGIVLLGAGAYLHAMIDAADGKTPTVAGSVAHTRLAEQVRATGGRVTVVLSDDQRRELGRALAEEGGPEVASSLVAFGIGVSFGSSVALHGVLACANEAGCAGIGALLKKARDARAKDFATRLVGFGAVLESVQIEAEGELVHVRVDIPNDQAATLLDRLIALRGMRHPLPKGDRPLDDQTPDPHGGAPSPRPPSSDAASAAQSASPPGPDEVLSARPTATAAPSSSAVAPPAAAPKP